MENIAVLKFGGTSVKSPARMKHVADIIASHPAKKLLVTVSAMGSTTDSLINLACQCSPDPDKRELDLLLSTGEQVAITLLTLTLQSLGLRARSFTGAQIGIFTDNSHSNAKIVHFDPVRLQRALKTHDVIVIAGFQGISQEGEITTLGRGGSDITAVAAAIASGASSCEIYSDVDGVFSADPNAVPDATLFDFLTYTDALNLARGGAQVIHPAAVELAAEANLQLRIKNTFNPEQLGTLIAADAKYQQHSTGDNVFDHRTGSTTPLSETSVA